MKLLNFRLIIIAILIASTGCEDFLIEKDPVNITTDFLYTTKTGLQNATVALYTIERNQVVDGDSPEGTYFAAIQGDAGTDIDFVRAGVPTNIARYMPSVMPTEGTIASWWKKWYRIIERANCIITYGSTSSLSEDDKKTALREAYIHRANAYFWLVRKFDNIWLNLEPTTAANVDARTYTVASQDEVYAAIVADLDIAIASYSKVDPSSGATTWDWTTVPGQYGLGAAIFLRIDVALWLKDYPTAITLCQRMFTESPYALVEPSEIFTKDGRLNTKETIYALQFDAYAPGGQSPNGSNPRIHRLPLTFTTQYRDVPGMKMVSEYGGYGWARIAPNEYMMGLYNKTYDKRYDAYWKSYYTYNDPAYNYSKVTYNFGDTLKPNQSGLAAAAGVAFLKSGSISCKKYWDWSKVPAVTTSATNIMIFRFAEVYLMAAEAYLKSTPSNISKTREYLTKLRMSRISPSDPNLTILFPTEQDILDEHAREMAFEGRRWFILKRFGKLVDQVRLHGGQSTFRGLMPADPSLPADPIKCIIPDYYIARTNIQDFHVRWPIPQSEIDAMGGTFPQNTGY
jgi:hypothetical protein